MGESLIKGLNEIEASNLSDIEFFLNGYKDAQGTQWQLQGTEWELQQNENRNRNYKQEQGKNPLISYKCGKHICTQHRSSQIYKGNLRGLWERYRQQHTYTRGF